MTTGQMAKLCGGVQRAAQGPIVDHHATDAGGASHSEVSTILCSIMAQAKWIIKLNYKIEIINIK